MFLATAPVMRLLGSSTRTENNWLAPAGSSSHGAARYTHQLHTLRAAMLEPSQQFTKPRTGGLDTTDVLILYALSMDSIIHVPRGERIDKKHIIQSECSLDRLGRDCPDPHLSRSIWDPTSLAPRRTALAGLTARIARFCPPESPLGTKKPRKTPRFSEA
jgi:hypothetical protein